MTAKERRLVRFAEGALQTLESNREWDSGTLDVIAACAQEEELATSDPEGYFALTGGRS